MIGMLIFFTVFAGLVFIVIDTAPHYDINPDNKYFGNDSGTTKRIGNIYNLSKDIQDKSDKDALEQSTLDAVIANSFNGIRLVGNVFAFSTDIINTIAVALEIPSLLLMAIMAAILITISLAIYAAVLGRRTD